MTDKQKTKQELIQELDILRQRVAALEQSELARKRAEEALRDSEGRFKTLFEESTEAQLLLDHSGKVVDCNTAFLDLFALQDETESMGHTPGDFAPEFQPDGTRSRERGHEVLKTVLERGSARYEWAHLKHDASRTPVLTELMCTLLSISGQPMIHVAIRDITARKRAEEALATSETRYRTLFEAANDAVFLHGVKQDGSPDMFVAVNNVAMQRLGFSAEEFTALTPADIDAGGFEEERRQAMEVIRSEGHATFEMVHQAKDGRRIPVEISSRQFVMGDRTFILSIARDITERKRAEQALRDSEERFRSLSDASLVGLMVHKQGVILDANLAFARLFGYEQPEELIGKNGIEFMLTPESRELIYQRLQRQESGPIELTGVRKDGITFTAETDSRPIKYLGHDANIVSCRDITERKRAEEALRTRTHQLEVVRGVSEEIARELNLDRLLDLILRRAIELTDADGGVIMLWDEKKGALFPRLRIGDYWADVPIRPIPLGEGVVGRVAASRKGTIVNDYRSWSGARPITLQHSTVTAAMGEPLIHRDKLIGVISLAHTDQKGTFEEHHGSLLRLFANQAAIAIENAHLYEEVHRELEERKHAQEALRHSEERYRSLVENSTDMIFIAQDGVIKFANPATMAILGYSEDELATLPFSARIHPEDRAIVMEKYQRRLQGQETPNTYSFRILTKQEDEVWVQVNAAPITWEGRPGVLCSLRDITSYKRLETQYLHAQKMEAIGTLAGGIAHDFNNILSAILGYAELASLDLKEGSKARYNLEHSMKAAHRAKDLVEQILAFSREGRQERKPLNIIPIVKEGLKFLRATLPATIEIHQEMEEDLGTIEADPTQVHQVLMNLCTNAAHAMEEKGGVLEVSLSNMDLDETSAASAGIGLAPTCDSG